MKHLRDHNAMRRRCAGRALRGTTRIVLWLAGMATRRRSIDAKWAPHFQVLLALRERLLRESVELLEQGSEALEPYLFDPADPTTNGFDQEFILSRLSTLQNALFEVDDAIERLLNGSYGVCEETGRPIPEARLKAAPWTRFACDVDAWRENIVSGLQPGRGGLFRGPLGGNGEGVEGHGEGFGGSVTDNEALRCNGSSSVRSNRGPAVPRSRRLVEHKTPKHL